MHPKIAFVFPGQGSQYIGMLGNISKEYSQVKATFIEASSVVGYDLWQLIQQGPIEKLNNTEFTQPALLTAGVAMWRVWQELAGLSPLVLAGHSLGEYTALVCAQALSLTDALSLVTKRGQLMQRVIIPGGGAMAAILGLTADEVVEICTTITNSTKQVVQAVNFNAPGQIVIAGTKEAVTAAIELAKNNGAKKTVLLPISVPSHCILMQPIAAQFALELQKVNWGLPKIPVIHNFDLKVHNDLPSIRNALEKQLYHPVRWLDIVQIMAEFGINIIAECGPGKVLTSLNKRIRNDLRCVALEDSGALLQQMVAERV